MVADNSIPESDIWGPSIILPSHNEGRGIIAGEKTIEEVERIVTSTTNALLDPSKDPALYEALVMNNIAPTVAYDKDGKLIVWNKAMEELTEYTFDEVRGLTSDEIMKLLYKGDDYDEVMYSLGELHRTGVGYKKKLFTMTTKSGKKKIVRWNTFPHAGGTGRSGEDLTEYYTTKGMLLKDPNFGCLNRTGLLDSLTRRISVTKEQKRIKEQERREKQEILEKMNQTQDLYSFIFGDIDDFKAFNDKYGHGIGDVVIQKLVDFFQANLREGDLVSRFGGDEFFLVLRNSNKIQSLSRLHELRSQFSRYSFERKPNGTIHEILHDSREQASLFIQEQKTLYPNSIFFGAIGTTWGITDMVYDKEKEQFEGFESLHKGVEKKGYLSLSYDNDPYKEQKKEDAIVVLKHKEAESDRVLLAAKYIGLLKEELGLHDDWKGKNGIGIPVYDKDGKLDGVKVQYDTFSLHITLAELVELEKRKAKIEIKRK